MKTRRILSMESKLRGFTLVEVMVVSTLLLSGSAILIGGVFSLRSSRIESQQSKEASQVLKETLETLQFLGVTESYFQYGPNSSGDPHPAPGSGAGEPFAASQLMDQSTSAPARVVINFYTDETLSVEEMGLPMDLDGDGITWTSDTSVLGPDGEIVAHILPVQVQLSWQGEDALREMTWQSSIYRDR